MTRRRTTLCVLVLGLLLVPAPAFVKSAAHPPAQPAAATDGWTWDDSVAVANGWTWDGATG